jgi:hypothetical protein
MEHEAWIAVGKTVVNLGGPLFVADDIPPARQRHRAGMEVVRYRAT